MARTLSTTRLRTVAPGILALGMLAIGLPARALTPAGTIITNQGFSTYRDAVGLSFSEVSSNLVTTTVAQVYGVQVGVANSSQNALPGTTVYYPATVTNTGNGPDRFGLSLSGDSPWPRRLYRDTNGNGTIDGGEPQVVETGLLPVEVTLRLVIAVDVPGDAAHGTVERTTLAAVSQDDPVTPPAVDAARVVTNVFSGPIVVSTKTASPDNVDPLTTDPGSRTVRYTIQVGNTGSAAATNVTVEDVFPTSPVGVLLSAPATANPAGVLEYFNAGTSAYETYTAANVPAYRRVKLTLASLAVNASAQLAFDVVVPEGATPGTMVNVATVQYLEAQNAGAPPTTTNTVTTTLIATPGVALEPSPQSGTTFPGATVQFTHTVTNTGNAPDTFNLTVSGLPAGWTARLLNAEGQTALADTTADGLPDSELLQPGASRTLIVEVKIPDGTPDGTVGDLRLLATDVDTATQAAAEDRLTIRTDAPAQITLVADPPVIFGDGKEQTKLTATVLTSLGTPVPDGTPVLFTTPVGQFTNGQQTFQTVTTNGLAVTHLSANLISSQPQTAQAKVVAGTPITGIAQASVDIIFTPSAIAGLVTNYQGLVPIANLPVTVVGIDVPYEGTVQNKPNGTYLVAVPLLGRYLVRIPVTNTLGNVVFVEQEVEVTAYGAIFRPTGAVVGVVMDANSREPIGSVELHLTPETPRSATSRATSRQGNVIVLRTNAQGGYVVNNLPLGSYSVEVFDAGGQYYAQGRLDVSLNQAGEYVINADLLLDPFGFVYDAETNARVANATVTLFDGNGTTLATVQTATGGGQYQFFIVGPGTYSLRVEAPGYRTFVGPPFVVTRDVVNVNVPLTPLPALTVTKAVDRPTAAPGEELAYTLTVRNSGLGTATGVVTTDTLPQHLTPVTGSLPAGATYDAATRTLQLPVAEVPRAGGVSTVSFRAVLDAVMPSGTTTVSNRATVTSALTPQPVTSNAATVTVSAAAGLRLTKTPVVPAATVGDTAKFTIVVENTGNAPATEVLVTDTLPTGLTAADGTDVLRWTLPQVLPGAPQTLTATVTVSGRSLAPGLHTVTNRVTAVAANVATPAQATADLQVLVPYLRVTKRALRGDVQTGDVVPFEIVAENLSQSDGLTAVDIRDLLPRELAFQPGTDRLDGALPAAPTVAGRTYTWRVAVLPAGATARLTFHTVVAAAGEDEFVYNTAEAGGLAPTGQTVTAQPIRVPIRRRERFFTDRGIILGRVFVDTNGNRVPDKGEPGIARAAVYTDTALMAITDDEGKFTLPDVDAGEHVVRLDLHTLPAGYRAVTTNNWNAGTAKSRFCTLPKGGIAKANFAVRGTGPTEGSAVPGTPLIKRNDTQRR